MPTAVEKSWVPDGFRSYAVGGQHARRRRQARHRACHAWRRAPHPHGTPSAHTCIVTSLLARMLRSAPHRLASHHTAPLCVVRIACIAHIASIASHDIASRLMHRLHRTHTMQTLHAHMLAQGLSKQKAAGTCKAEAEAFSLVQIGDICEALMPRTW